MTTATFQPSLLLSPASMHRFVSGQEEVSEILQAARSPVAAAHGRTWSQWSVACSAVKGVFLMVASCMLQAVCMADLSKRAWVASRHAIHGATAAKTEKVFQSSLLSGSVNTHREDTADFFLSRPAPTTLETCPTPGTMHFFHKEGICRGMCHWFIHLYFKTHGEIPDPDTCMRAVGTHFAQGASRQAAFLNSLQLSAVHDLLGLRVDESTIRTPGKSEEQLIAAFQIRPPGVYGIYIASHQLVYIKVDASRQYLFDPNQGVIRLESASLFKKAMEQYFEDHDPNIDILFDLYSR